MKMERCSKRKRAKKMTDTGLIDHEWAERRKEVPKIVVNVMV